MRLEELDLANPRSRQTKAYCPLCHDKRKRHKSDRSLAVNRETGAFFCHHCSTTGVLEGYAGEVMTQGFAQREERHYSRPDADELKKQSIEYDEKVLEYFKNRGISKATLETFGVSYGKSFHRFGPDGRFAKEDGVPIVDNGLRFPYYEDSKLVNVKHLLPKEWAHDGERKFKSFNDGKPVPFHLSGVFEDGIITEGEIDAMSVYEADMSFVMSVPSGAKNLHWLDFPSVVKVLESLNTIYLAGDADEEGIKMRDELIRRLGVMVGVEKLRIVEWPEECKDANDTLIKYGPEKVKECILDLSKLVPVDGISEVSEFETEFLDYYRNGLPRGLSTGIDALDPLYRVMPGMLTVVTGITNQGKSECIDELVRGMINEHKWKFAFYTPENHPTSLHMIKLAEKYIGKPFDVERPGAMSEDEVRQAMTWMNENIFYINPRGTAFSVDEIIQKAKVLIYRKGINGLIIDPWNYVRKDFGPLREDQYINQELQKLGTFAKDTKIHIWLIVHPRTLRRDMKTNKLQVPTIHDLSGGSKFGDNADFVFSVSRDPLEAKKTGINKVTIHVQKVRYRYAGSQGQANVIWQPFNGRFLSDTAPTTLTAPEDENIDIDKEIEDEF